MFAVAAPGPGHGPGHAGDVVSNSIICRPGPARPPAASGSRAASATSSAGSKEGRHRGLLDGRRPGPAHPLDQGVGRGGSSSSAWGRRGHSGAQRPQAATGPVRSRTNRNWTSPSTFVSSLEPPGLGGSVRGRGVWPASRPQFIKATKPVGQVKGQPVSARHALPGPNPRGRMWHRCHLVRAGPVRVGPAPRRLTAGTRYLRSGPRSLQTKPAAAHE